MNREALFSDGTEQFLVPSEPKKNEVVTIRFRTAKNDVDFVRVISGSRAFVMRKICSEGVFDYHEVRWKLGEEPYYPINNEKNVLLYQRYKELAERENKVCFGGRIAEYKYY